jgi:hypothetical protein
MSQMQATDVGHVLTGELGMIGIHEDHIDGKVCNGTQDDIHIHAAGLHPEFRAPAQRANQQLALHLIGVGDQDADRT